MRSAEDESGGARRRAGAQPRAPAGGGIINGESHPSPEAQNLRGKPIRHYDGAGALKSESYDFKGNPLVTQRNLALAFTAATDWTPLATATTPSAIDAAAAALLETETFTQSRTFDALNRVTSQTEPDLTEIKPTYNQRGLLDQVEARIRNAASWTPFVSSIEYDAKAQRQSIAYGNGTTTTYQYDELTHRLRLLTTTRTSPSNTLQDLSYTFDAAGNIVQITDAAQQNLFYNNSVVLPQNLFEYDALCRLVAATGREHASIGDVQVDHNDVPLQNLPHNNDPSAVRTYLEEYSYDHVGNILEMFHEAAGTPVATWTRTYTYASGSNRLSSNTIPGGTATYTHDAHGNITAMPHLAAITYSPWDQMQSADLGGGGDVYFTYGSDGQRVRKVWQQTASAVKERIYLGGYEIYREKISGVTQLERQTLHLMDGVQRIAMVETKTIEGGTPITTPTPRYRFQLGNHLGSAMLEVDETGLIISYEEYAPYGTSAYRGARSGVEVSARRYRYTGKERDDETGLYYYGARYYAAWLGRWTSADPPGIGADGPGLYNYVRGSPVTLTDPNGKESWSEETVQRHADRRPPPRPAPEPTAEPEVPDDLTTGQTIDPRMGLGVEAVEFTGAAALSDRDVERMIVEAGAAARGLTYDPAYAVALLASAGPQRSFQPSRRFESPVATAVSGAIEELNVLSDTAATPGERGIATVLSAFMAGFVPFAEATNVPSRALTIAEYTGSDLSTAAAARASVHELTSTALAALAFTGGAAASRGTSAAAMGPEGIVTSSRTSTQRLVTVTSWADAGIAPDLASGRWVQLGDATRWNYIKSGLPGPKAYQADSFPYVRLEGSRSEFTNSITGEIPEANLSWPPGLEVWKGVLGQRVIKP